MESIPESATMCYTIAPLMTTRISTCEEIDAQRNANTSPITDLRVQFARLFADGTLYYTAA